MSMIEGFLHCGSCGNVFAVEDIDITGRCPECWKKALEEHDLLMRTIIWREKGELVPVGRYACLENEQAEQGKEAGHAT